MNKRRTKYLRELFRYKGGTIRIATDGEVIRERVRFVIGPRGEWLSIPVR